MYNLIITILLYLSLASILTYIVLGFLFAFEGVLAMSGSKFAIRWIRKKFTLKGFIFASKFCYPFFIIVYFLMEKLPYILKMDDELIEFDMDKMILNIFEDEYKF